MWARDRRIGLVKGPRSSKALCTSTLEENLFEVTETELLAEFGSGRGRELGWKMRSVHSSSALAVNVFHHWRKTERQATILGALGLSAEGLGGFRFEAMLPTRRPWITPHLDVFFPAGGEPAAGPVGIESKFTEPFLHNPKPMPPGYLLKEPLLNQHRSLRTLADSLPKKGERRARKDFDFKHLDTVQLIAHILGLRRLCEPVGARSVPVLVYLYYDAPGPEGTTHLNEIKRFAEVARADSIAFEHRSYQSVFDHFERSLRGPDTEYLDYVKGRYIQKGLTWPHDNGGPPR
jgi:hypothetical protein